MMTINSLYKKRIYLISCLILTLLFLLIIPSNTAYGAIKKDNVNDEIPTAFIPLYQKAAKKYGISWFLLASVHNQETSFSSNVSESSAGALGHTQFMRCTWVGWSYPGCKGTNGNNNSITNEMLKKPDVIAKYKGLGEDGNQDGKADPWDLVDAVYTMAKYLSRNGAASKDGSEKEQIMDALWGYNKDKKYGEEVYNRYMRYKKEWEGTSPEGTDEITWKTDKDGWAKDYYLQVDGTSTGDLGQEVSKSSDLKGETFSYVSPFSSYESDINHLGVNDGQNYDSSYTSYKVSRYIGKIRDYLLVISYVIGILIGLYMAILWLAVLLARTHLHSMYQFALKITFNHIDAHTDLGKLFKVTLIASLVIIICLSGLLPKAFQLIFWLFSTFITWLFRL